MTDQSAGPAAEPTHVGSVADLVDDYRRLRAELERGILPLATSVDGRRFTFQASLHQLQLQTGGYVVLEGEGQPRLGQILTMRSDSTSAPYRGSDGTTS